MKINNNYKKYFHLLKTTNNLKNHFLIEVDFLSSEIMIKQILKILICKKNFECFPECFDCKGIDFEDLNYFFKFNIIDKNQIDEVSRLILWSKLKLKKKYKFFWIPQAEFLTIAASNKLLKFLEDDTTSVIGFLTTNFKSKILPTILSRVTILKFIKNIKLEEFSNKEKEILNTISLKFQDENIFEIKKKIFESKKLVDLFLDKIENKKIDDFLFLPNEKFLLENFYLFLEILILNLEKKKIINFEFVKLIKILLKINSKNQKLKKISNNLLSPKIQIIKLIENVKKLFS